MPVTILSDIIQPAEWARYITEETAAKSRLIQSGIAERNPEFDARAAAPGNLVSMPYWQDLTGASTPIDDQTALTVSNVTAGQDAAAILERHKAFGAHDLVGWRTADDPLAWIASRYGAFWARDHQTILVSILKGIFSAASMAGNATSIATTAAGTPLVGNTLTANSFLAAKQLLGDSKDELTAVMMHSAVGTYLAQLDLVDQFPDSQGTGTIKRLLGAEVIEDDSLAAVNPGGGIALRYTTYLFGRGALAWGVTDQPKSAPGASPGSDWYVELARDALGGSSSIINRVRQILHPRGVKFTANTVAQDTASNANLELAANWLRVYENKNVRIVAITHNIL